MAIDWSDIYSRKVRDAFRIALSDKELTHTEVVDVVKFLLSDGELDGTEINDLQKIAKGSGSMPERSKMFLLNLAYEAFQYKSRGPIGIYTDRQKFAAGLIFDFLKGTGSGRFPGLNRDRVGIDLLYRVANPNVINQGNATLCGPVGFLYSVAFDSPSTYAKYAIDLFEKGRAKIGRIEVEPSSDCRNYMPTGSVSHGEWLTAGSLRDSENFLLDYDDVERSGSTRASEIARWMSKAGYKDVRSDDNLLTRRDASDIQMINGLYNQGYRVILRVNSKVLKPKEQNESSWRGNHFVVLRSPINVVGNEVKVTVYTWGWGQWNIPGPGTKMSPGGFREHWYGYVAAKPF